MLVLAVILALYFAGIGLFVGVIPARPHALSRFEFFLCASISVSLCAGVGFCVPVLIWATWHVIRTESSITLQSFALAWFIGLYSCVGVIFWRLFFSITEPEEHKLVLHGNDFVWKSVLPSFLHDVQRHFFVPIAVLYSLAGVWLLWMYSVLLYPRIPPAGGGGAPRQIHVTTHNDALERLGEDIEKAGGKFMLVHQNQQSIFVQIQEGDNITKRLVIPWNSLDYYSIEADRARDPNDHANGK